MDGSAAIEWVGGIQAQYLPSVWAQAAPLIERALGRGRNEYRLEDIEAAIKCRDMQLWAYGVRASISAVAVTEILNYPRRRVCVVVLTGGECKGAWAEAAGKIEEWAKAQGCDEIRAIGRGGWSRAIPGWVQLDVVSGKVLT